MDRIEAITVFLTALDEGSLAAAARRLKRSPAAVSRAIAFLETRVGAELLHRTTRSMVLSEAGERYATACRRILAELEEAEALAGGEHAVARGVLSISAPPISGEDVLRPIVDDFLDAYPMVSVRFLLLDRPVNLIEEGIDVAMRIADLPDSSMIATRIGTEVRRVVVGSPDYLSRHPRIAKPSDLAAHEIIAFTNFGIDFVEFRARRRLQDAARGSIQSTHDGEQGAGGACLRHQGAGPDPALFLSCCGCRPARRTADRSGECRASSGSRPFADAERADSDAQGQGVHRLRGAAAAIRVLAPGDGSPHAPVGYGA